MERESGKGRSVSYAVTVWNEKEEIKRLLPFLLENKREEDEIVVLWDQSGPQEVWDYLSSLEVLVLAKGKFEGHFADWKNKLTGLCTKDYIYQIDADELISEYVMNILPDVLTSNDVDVIRVPRINTVEGLTQEHIQKWRWQVDERGYVNFPDMQFRIYKNDPSIRWVNKVHEVLEGYKVLAHLPTDEEWCLIHHKDIQRQEKQNQYYSTL